MTSLVVVDVSIQSYSPSTPLFHFPVLIFVHSLLPALLVRLTQISATVSMAAPMLEFLSGKGSCCLVFLH